MAKVKFILLVPLTFNDGSEVSKDVLAGIEDELFVLAGGCTVNGTVKGSYRMSDGSKQTDTLLELWVVVAEEDQGELRELVGKYGRMLGQESMYLERVNSDVEFIPSSPSEE